MMGLFKFINKSDEESKLEKIFAYSSEDLEYLNDEELDTEFRYLSANFSRTVDMANALNEEIRKRGLAEPTETSLYQALYKTEAPASEPEGEQATDLTSTEYLIKHRGKRNPVVMMVGSCLSKLDLARGSVMSGPVAKTLRESFIPHLGVGESEVHLATIVPEYLEDDNGSPREPTQEEVDRWLPEFRKHVETVKPQFVVALGKTANAAIESDEWVPHPLAVMMYGDSGEVERKLSRLRKDVVNWIADNTKEVVAQVSKMDDEKRLVYGVVMEPGVEDADGNWTDEDNIEYAAHYYMANSRVIKKEHMDEMESVEVVESYVAPVEFKLGEDTVLKGSWVLVTKVHDDEEWADIKKNGGGYSFAGVAKINPTRRL